MFKKIISFICVLVLTLAICIPFFVFAASSDTSLKFLSVSIDSQTRVLDHTLSEHTLKVGDGTKGVLVTSSTTNPNAFSYVEEGTTEFADGSLQLVVKVNIIAEDGTTAEIRITINKESYVPPASISSDSSDAGASSTQDVTSGNDTSSIDSPVSSEVIISSEISSNNLPDASFSESDFLSPIVSADDVTPKSKNPDFLGSVVLICIIISIIAVTAVLLVNSFGYNRKTNMRTQKKAQKKPLLSENYRSYKYRRK